jgi:hypothetical protein
VFVLEAVENCLDGGRGGEGDGYMSVSIGGDDSGQPTDGSLWGCSCGGSARERVVGATWSGVIRMAEVPRGRLGQGRFLNRLRFAEVNAERSREIFTHWTNIFLFSYVCCLRAPFHNVFHCIFQASASTMATATLDSNSNAIYSQETSASKPISRLPSLTTPPPHDPHLI